MLKRIKLGVRRRFMRLQKYFLYINVEKYLFEMASDTDFPSSAGTSRQHLDQLSFGSRATPQLLVNASKHMGRNESLEIWPLHSKYPQNEESVTLNELLDFHGSDKGTFHEYSAAYAGILNSFRRKHLGDWSGNKQYRYVVQHGCAW